MKRAFTGITAAIALSLSTACLTTSQQTTPRDRFASMPRSEWRKRLNWPQSCERAFAQTRDNSGAETGIRSFELGNGWRLIEVRCAEGAYQPSQMFIGLSPAGATTAPLIVPVVTFDDRGEPRWTNEPEAWGTVEFDDTTHQVAITNVSRGLGDCGSQVAYRINTDGVAHFDVVSARGKACDDKAQSPSAWPRIR